MKQITKIMGCCFLACFFLLGSFIGFARAAILMVTGVYIFFLPGHLLSLIIFPEKKGIELSQRILLSISGSIALIPLVFFYVQKAGVSMGIAAIVLTVTVLNLIAVLVILHRKKGKRKQR